MFPIYKFTLSVNGVEQNVFPLRKDDMAIEYALEQNEEFYRGKLSGKLTFLRDDFAFISAQPFDTRFDVVMLISYDKGATWTEYWAGQFWKTDCEIDEDAQTVVVTPSTTDRYADVIAGMDKEFNLIELAPAINAIKFDKRSMVQIYSPGASVIGCYLAGMWWEQDCEAIAETNKLQDQYHFSVQTHWAFLVEQAGTPLLPATFSGFAPGTSYPISKLYYPVGDDGAYRIVFYVTHSGSNFTYSVSIQVRNAGIWQVYWSVTFTRQGPLPLPATVVLSPVDAEAEGNVTLTINSYTIASRLITDATEVSGTSTFALDTDMVPNVRNYKRVMPYTYDDTIVFYSKKTSTPTQWGLYRPNLYYASPAGLEQLMGILEAYPIARNLWDTMSIWFSPNVEYLDLEEASRTTYSLRDAYPISSVISVLLGQIAPGITHGGTTTYSQFLYGTNAVKPEQQFIHITPKSNLVFYPYDQPAQKAPITLGNVLNMLRDCYRCYWFIDDQKRFRIEHISWFMNGGSYSGTPAIGIDLTAQKVTRTGKPWSFARKHYTFDKPDMPARYQFGWMDDVTQIFEGFPIDVISKYVEPTNIKDITVNLFTSDVDYILLNPDNISKDGFVLLGAVYEGGEYKLPYYNFGFIFDYTEYIVQNAYAAFVYLQKFYMYDMPAPDVEIAGVAQDVQGTKKLKTQNNVKFPVLYDPDLMKLVKTELGNGTIQKMVINLSSRNANATLKYDTE